MDLRKFAVDIEKEVEGVWVDIGDRTRLKIARANNPAYNKLFLKLSQPYSRMAKNGLMPENKARELFAEVTAKTILLDWENLELDNQNIPYSIEKAQEILQNPEFQPFKKFIDEFSQDEANFRQEEIAKEMGELPSS